MFIPSKYEVDMFQSAIRYRANKFSLTEEIIEFVILNVKYFIN
jgi:hypothetical protein